MMKLNKQINSELHKTYRALHWNMNPGRRNPYKDMMVSDVKTLNQLYKLLLDGKHARCGNLKHVQVCRLVDMMDTACFEEIPSRIRNHLRWLPR